MEEILDSTVVAVNEERDHLRAATGDDEELLEAINLSFAVADEEAGEDDQLGEDRRANNTGRDQRARLIAETRIYQDDLGRGGRLSMEHILTTVVGNVLQAAGPLIELSAILLPALRLAEGSWLADGNNNNESNE
jgi:hypothetical protein